MTDVVHGTIDTTATSGDQGRYESAESGLRSLSSYNETDGNAQMVSMENLATDLFIMQPPWPFTSFAPEGQKRSEVGTDRSFEELRYAELKLMKVQHWSKEDVIEKTRLAVQKELKLKKEYYEAKRAALAQTRSPINEGHGPQNGFSPHIIEPSHQKLASLLDVPDAKKEVNQPSSLMRSTSHKENESREEFPSQLGSEDEDNPWTANVFTVIPDGAPSLKCVDAISNSVKETMA